MAKSPIKTLINEKAPINNAYHTLSEYPTPNKSRQEINRENYQKRKEQRKEKRRARYQQHKLQDQQINNEQLSKYSDASDYKILMSLKRYTELNPSKRENWLKFAWVFRELADRSDIEVKNIAVSDIIQVMKLREQAENLINDYWETAKSEVCRSKYWNDLEQEEKDRLVKYFGRKKARFEESLEAKLVDEEERGQKWEKELYMMIEAVKHHEERGRKGCSCYYCQVHKEVQEEVRAEEKKAKTELKEYLKKVDEGNEETEWEDGECAECYEYKKVSTESGLCRKCEREANEGYSDD